MQNTKNFRFVTKEKNILIHPETNKYIDLLKIIDILKVIFARTQNKELSRAWNIQNFCSLFTHYTNSCLLRQPE